MTTLRPSFAKTARNTAAATCLLATLALPGMAQNTPVSKLPWSQFLKPVVLGSGLQVQPNLVAVVNQGVDTPSAPNVLWQNKQTNFTLLDYTDLTSTLSNLHLNAWAEYDGFVGGGSFSVDFNQYKAFQGNHRHWEIDALRNWTAIIPNPILNAAAQKVTNDPTTFRNQYGNYAVTGIQYRRQIQISFDAEFDSSLSSTQFDAAIKASYGCFSGGGSVSAAQNALSQFAQVTVNITVIGQGGGQLIASGSTGNLDSLRQAVYTQLQTWDATPANPNDAGTVDTVFVTPYTAVPPKVSVVPQQSPDQQVMMTALAKFAYLQSAIARLNDIQQHDANLNPMLTAYLFGINNKLGSHIPGTGKMDEAVADRNKQLAYLKSLHNADGKVPDPGIVFQFVDPDVIQWRVVEAAKTSNAHVFYVELYGNARVSPVVLYSKNSYDNWTNQLLLTPSTGLYRTDRDIVESDSYLANLDPVTGIPHRFVLIRWPSPAPPSDATLALISDGGDWFYNATDWSGWPTPALFVPDAQQINMQ